MTISQGFIHLWQRAEKQGNAEFLEKRLSELVDTIKYRVPKRGIEETVDSLLEEIWDLRLKSLKYQALMGKFPETSWDLSEILISGQEVLDRQVKFAWEILFKLNASTAGQIKTQFSTSLEQAPAYAWIKQHLSEMKQWSFQALLLMMDASLQMEAALLMVREYVKGELEADAQELGLFTRRAAERLAAYAILLDLWHPDPEDESQAIRNVKILASSFSKGKEPHRRFNREELIHRNLLKAI